LAHELGHLLGLDDLDPVDRAHDLMSARLSPGVRRMPAMEMHESTALDEDWMAEAGTEPVSWAELLYPSGESDPVTAQEEREARGAFFARLDDAFDVGSRVFSRNQIGKGEDRDAKEAIWWLLYGTA
jgi:hypothetical protein